MPGQVQRPGGYTLGFSHQTNLCAVATTASDRQVTDIGVTGLLPSEAVEKVLSVPPGRSR